MRILYLDIDTLRPDHLGCYGYTREDTIKGITFDVFQGEVFGLLGPSGAGKSTTQKILTIPTPQGQHKTDGRMGHTADHYKQQKQPVIESEPMDQE